MEDIVVKSPVNDTPAGPPVESEPIIQDVAKQSDTPPPEPVKAVADETKGQEAEKHEEKLPAPDSQKPKSGVPKIAIGLASFVCLSLVGLVIYLAMNGGLGKEQTTTDSKASGTTEQTTQAQNQTDLQTLGQEATILPEPGSDPSSDLSDQSLGL